MGLDLYGRPTDEDMVPHPPDSASAVHHSTAGEHADTVRQSGHPYYLLRYSYELSAEFPGSPWTNVFFLSSMGLAAAGGFVQLREETGLRKSSPDEFPPGPVELVKRYVPRWWGEWRKERRKWRGGMGGRVR